MKLSEKVRLYLADDKSVELTLCRWLIVQVKKYDATFINTHTNREQIVHTKISILQFSLGSFNRNRIIKSINFVLRY